MKWIKHSYQRIKFITGFDPVIKQSDFYKKYIPTPHKAVLCISADFELAWAWRYSKSSSDPLQKAIQKARQERINMPKILLLLEKYSIPVTWFTVGHLFLDSCKKTGGIPHPELPRIQQFENEYWKFDKKDWFEYDPCSDYIEAPEWYCPDLIKQIIESPIKHEIGCHTFSHIDCRDEVCKPEVLQAELQECKRLAGILGINLKSFVHPAHTIGNLSVLADEGFTNFRTDYQNVLGYPIIHSSGLFEFQQTMEFRYYKYWSIEYQIKRYITILKRAIKSNTVCVFWFHPSMNPIFIEKIWPEVFDFISQNTEKIWVTTHSEYISKISNENQTSNQRFN